MKLRKPKTCKEEQTMNRVYTIFAELLKLCPRYQFEKATERYRGTRYVKTFATWQQYIAILYSRITLKDSLRDIETGLGTQSGRWYHPGLRVCTGAHSPMPTRKGIPGSSRICSAASSGGAGT